LKKCSEALSDAADAHKGMLDAMGGGEEGESKKTEPVGDIAKAVAAGVAEALKIAGIGAPVVAPTVPAFRLPGEAHRSPGVRKAVTSQAVEVELDDIQKRASEGDEVAQMTLIRRNPISNIATLGA
jgi:hypothetical protein